jgi:DNA polymerase III delta prime subunit
VYDDENTVTALDWELKSKLFGQPLVHNLVMTVMRHHLDPEHSTRKALVLSFHGFPGTGKNFLADMISRSLFKLGVKSKFRHFYSGRFSFPHDSEINTYKVSYIGSNPKLQSIFFGSCRDKQKK